MEHTTFCSVLIVLIYSIQALIQYSKTGLVVASRGAGLSQNADKLVIGQLFSHLADKRLPDVLVSFARYSKGCYHCSRLSSSYH